MGEQNFSKEAGAVKKPLIHLWIPNIFEFKGGIQVYSAFLLQALQELYPHLRYRIFLKHDTRFPPDSSWTDETNFHFTGKWPLSIRTFVYALQMMGYGLWQRPDWIIMTHLNFTPAAYWLKQLAGVPYWAVAHGIEAWNIQNPSLQKALQGADRILAVSNYTRDRLLSEQDLDPARVGILPNTFDATRFQIAPKPGYLLKRYALRPDQPIILTVTRLDTDSLYKGYDRLLMALPHIRQVLPDVHYVLVGKGNDRPRVEQLIQQLALEDCVTLAGFVPDHELNDYYNLCDVFAMPSKGEGFGIVYLEALACGKPTLGGNQDGAIDALCQGELGVLVNPDDVDVIAKTLIQVLKQTYPHAYLYQPEVLRQKVLEIYGFDRFQKTLDDIMQAFPGKLKV